MSSLVGSGVAATVPSAWDAICKSFVQAASSVLQSFGKAFTALPNLNPADAAISRPYALALVLAASVAALLIFGQVAKVAWTHDGSGLAQALTGGAKAAAAWMLTISVATVSLAAANQVTKWIVQGTFGSQAAFSVKLGEIVNWSEVTGKPGQVAVGGSMLLVIALVGIVLTIVLWFELLLRNAALGVLIAMSPIAAAGQLGETTKVWWQRTVSASVQLIILKPVIALVFFIGFKMSQNAHGIEAVLEGLLVLVLAVFSWPVIARFFTFTTIQASSSGLATALGFVAGRMSSGGGQTAGPAPQDWSLGAAQRTMASRGGVTSGEGPGEEAVPGAAPAGTGGGTAASAPGGPAGGGAGGSGGRGSSVLAGIGWALQTANRAGTMLAGRMEQSAANAGMPGAYPYSTVGGGQHAGPARFRRAPRDPGGTPPGGPVQEQPPQATYTDAPETASGIQPMADARPADGTGTPPRNEAGDAGTQPVPPMPAPPLTPRNTTAMPGDVPDAPGSTASEISDEGDQS